GSAHEGGDGRIGGEREAQGVLACSRTDDEDAHERRAYRRATDTTVRPVRVGTSRSLPVIAGVAKREVVPTSTWAADRPVAGFSACSTPASGSRDQTRPPPTTGEPVVDSFACHSTCRCPVLSMRTARTPSVQGTYTTSPTTA